MSSRIKAKQILVDTSFNINNQKLINVGNPSSNLDGANKLYVDTISGVTLSGLSSLSTVLSTETSNRISSDLSLSSNLSTEISSRISADNSLSTAISTMNTTPLHTVLNITGNTSLGTILSGVTLGMIYITNTGTSTSYVNLGITPTGNEINVGGLIEIPSGTTDSITINTRLSNTESKIIYISSSNWTNVNLTVEWSLISYDNVSKRSKSELTLLRTSWTTGYTYQLITTGIIDITENNIVILSPSTKTDSVYWANSGVFCSAQLTNELDFTCDEIPDSDIKINISVLW